MKKLLFTGLLATALTAQAAEVMTWVPPYSVAQSKAMLNQDFGGVGMKDGLTRLALQFWNPTSSGGLEKTDRYGVVSDAKIAEFKTWGNNNNVKVLLCIYNGENGWDWSLAQAAFNNKAKFIADIIAEVDRLGLDGVDMDLESSSDESPADKAAYLSMMSDLSSALRAKGKILTVATFYSKFNAPSWEYWSALSPIVDGITPMGYEQIGYQASCPSLWGHSSDWCTYQGQINAAGSFDKTKLTMGMPGNVEYASSASSWMGKSVTQQLDGIAALGTGVAIWDAYLHSSWQTATVWNKLKAIKGTSGNSSTAVSSVASSSDAGSSAVGSSSTTTTGACTRELVANFAYNVVNGDTYVQGYQQSNYPAFSVGDLVVAQGDDCSTAVAVSTKPDEWGLALEEGFKGASRTNVNLEKVTFTTSSSEAQSSVAASSVAMSSTALSSVASSSSQNTSSAVIVNSDNYVEMGEWAATEDSEGSTSNPTDDADLIKDDTVHVTYVQVAKSGATWPWTSLVMTPKDKQDMDLSTSTGVTVTYKASMKTFIRLNQHNPDIADGKQYRYELPASPFAFNTVTLPVSSFAQADWVVNDGVDQPLNASEIWSIDFVPNIDTTGGTASITIKTLELGIPGTSSVATSSSMGVSSSDNVTAVENSGRNLVIAGRETLLKSGSFQLIGLNGQAIKSGKASELSRTLRVQESGVYFLRVVDGISSKVSKLTLK